MVLDSTSVQTIVLGGNHPFILIFRIYRVYRKTVALIMTYIIISAINQNLLFVAAIFAMITSDEVAGQMARPIPLCVTGMYRTVGGMSFCVTFSIVPFPYVCE